MGAVNIREQRSRLCFFQQPRSTWSHAGAGFLEAIKLNQHNFKLKSEYDHDLFIIAVCSYFALQSNCMPEPTFLFNPFHSNVFYFNLLFYLTLLNLICSCLLSSPCSGNIFHPTGLTRLITISMQNCLFLSCFTAISHSVLFFFCWKEDLCICALCCIYKCITEEVEWAGFAVSYLVSARGFSYEWLTNCFLKCIQGRFFFSSLQSVQILCGKNPTSCCHQTASDSRRCFSLCDSETIKYFEIHKNGNMNSCFSISASFFLQKHFSQMVSLSITQYTFVYEQEQTAVKVLYCNKPVFMDIVL